MTTSKSPLDSGDARVMSGELWEVFCGTLQRASKLVVGDGVPGSPGNRAEGFRYLTRFLAAGIRVCVEHADADYPELCRSIDYDSKWGLDCPDCLYLYATVRGDATYRLGGNRGSANQLDIQVNYGHFADGAVESWGTISSTSGLDMEIQPDGSFELILSADEHPGNWLRLEPNAEFILIRQYFNDWENERPADLTIERVGASYPAPPPRTDQMAVRIERLITWFEKGAVLWEQMSKGLMEMEPNTLNVHLMDHSDQHAGMRGQAYGLGNFRCRPDEAVIVEFEPPQCHQWSVSLANWYWESFDFTTRQTSLNGHQSRLDGDGIFRGVIAHEDPGVTNWLDAAGHEQGTVAARFLRAESAPQPKLRAVPLAKLRTELPAETPRIDPATRAEILERRRRAVWRRYRL